MPIFWVGSDWGRGDLYNVIFNSLDIHHVFFFFFQFSSSERVQLSFYCLWHHHARQPSHHQQGFPCSPFNTLSPCHCNQLRDTGHELSSLIVKFLIFIFFFFPSGLGTVHDILKQHIFFLSSSIRDFTCNQLGHPHYLSTSFHFLFWLLSKILFQNFQFFFPDISIFTLLGNYIWLLNFLVNPSRTAIDQYCHTKFEQIFLFKK